ncbi:MAG: T9SS type A sorting domain-containing protein, partial [Cryomorphaceae bacterium]
PTDAGGVWTSPNGSAVANGIFNPSFHPYGTYTYTVNNGQCEFFRSFEVYDSFLGELGQGEVSFYESFNIGFNLNSIPSVTPLAFNLPADGFWQNPLGEILEDNILIWQEDPPGLYTYFFSFGAECLLSYTVQITFDVLPDPFDPASSFQLIPYDETFTGSELFEDDEISPSSSIVIFDSLDNFQLLLLSPFNSITANDLNNNGSTDGFGDFLLDGYAVAYYGDPIFGFLSDTVFFEILYPEECADTYVDSIASCSSIELNALLPEDFCPGGVWTTPFGTQLANDLIQNQESTPGGTYFYFESLPNGCPCLGSINVEFLEDDDGDGICNDFEIVGCQDSEAINYNPSATDPDTCYYSAQATVEWAISPVAENGAYFLGDQITICLDIVSAQLDWGDGNSFHGIELLIPEGFTTESATNPMEPFNCGNSDETSNYIWIDDMPQSTVQSGWFLDSDNDGDPTNNLGDICTINTTIEGFCIDLTVVDECISVESNEELFATFSAKITPDGLTGSQPQIAEAIDILETVTVAINCCDAFPGTLASDSLFLCDNVEYDLFENFLPPYDDGVWLDPLGNEIESGIFLGALNPYGSYSFVVDGADCSNSISVEILPSDFGVLIDESICAIGSISLDSLFESNIPNYIPDGGVWTDEGGMVIDDGLIVNPTVNSALYQYSFLQENGCELLFSVDLEFLGLANPSTQTSICLDGGPIDLQSLFLTSPDNSSIVYYNQNGDFLAFYTDGNFSIDPYNFDGGMDDGTSDDLIDGYFINPYLIEPCPLVIDTAFVFISDSIETSSQDSIITCSVISLASYLPMQCGAGGFWTGPFGSLAPPFISPGISPPGLYTYSGMSGDCICTGTLHVEWLSDTDGDGICDDSEIVGCQDPTADNYNPDATDPGPCGQVAVQPDGPSTISFPAGSALSGRPSPGFTAFPNPLKEGDLTIQFSGSSSGGRVVVYDLLGKVVFQDVVPNEQNVLTIPASHFIAAGVYLISFKNIDGLSSYQKVMVAK